MPAQIFAFPGSPSGTPTMMTPETAGVTYAKIAAKIVANCSSYNLDPMVLAGAIVAAVEAQKIKTAAMDVVADKIAPVPPKYTAQAQLYAQPLPAYSDPANEYRGAKYRQGQDVVDIAKALRKDIKEARKTTLAMLPAHATVSVTTSRYSMGCSITVRVKGLQAAEKWNVPGVLTRPYGDGRTELCKNITAACTELMNAYKRDNSDSMTDYYDVNFSGSVTFD
jgi:hypothetical protein